MLFRFAQFELDCDRFELRRLGIVVPVEPQVLSLLLLLAAARGRLVSKDEIIRQVWGGRIVSDEALSSRIKSARQALGDNGRSQVFIRTVYGRGFCFVQPVEGIAGAVPCEPAAPADVPALPDSARPAIAVLPFRLLGGGSDHAVMADGLPHEIIAELSRLRWLFVIARGSSFRFRGTGFDLRQIGATLRVRYLLTGAMEVLNDRTALTVELVSARDAGVLWGDRYLFQASDVHDVRSRIVRSVVTALDIQIPLSEAARARLMPPEHLDAWSAYHLGIQHMFRFTREDNDAATAMFERAARIEPAFGRAYGGLSFTHFQNAFMGYGGRNGADSAAAQRFAERALELDPFDPFANFNMGRSLWLRQDVEASLPWLDRALELSPSYAQGHYSRAWTEAMLGEAAGARAYADEAMALSPLDPLRYAFLATRALSHLLRGETAEAARWSALAAREPRAHVMITAIAMACHALDGDAERALRWATRMRAQDPDLTDQHFFRSFPFADLGMRDRISAAFEFAKP